MRQDFAHLSSEGAALESGRSLRFRSTVEVIVVEGADAASFLQGQLTQDIERIRDERSGWSFVLEPDGKFGFLVRVIFLSDDRFLVLGSGTHSEGLFARLERFRFRVAVTLRRVSFTLCSGALSPHEQSHAIDLCSLLPEVPEWLVPIADADRDRESESSFLAAWALRRRQIGPDDVEEGMNPYEVGAEVIARSVSYTKGCYTGQELVARMDARGAQAPFRLCWLEIQGIPEDNDIRLGVDVVGEIVHLVVDSDAQVAYASARIKRTVETTDSLPCTAGGVPAFLSEF